MRNLTIIIFSLSLFFVLPVFPASASNTSASEVVSDFPDNPMVARMNKKSADFYFYAYFLYMNSGMCNKALYWLDELKKIDIDYANNVYGIAYANGDCLPANIHLAEMYLRQCSSKFESCKASLIRLFSEQEVKRPEIFTLSLEQAKKGGFTGIYALIDCYLQGIGTIPDEVEALVWMYVAISGNINDEIRAILRHGIASIEENMEKKSILKCREKAKSIRESFLKNAKNKKRDDRHLDFIYGIVPRN